MASSKTIVYAPQVEKDLIIEIALTKTPSVIYQNYLREFWCTAVVHLSKPPNDDSEPKPLKESIIKFTVQNGNTPLAFNYQTFCQTTVHDYNNDEYVTMPQTKVVKAELIKLGLHNDKNEAETTNVKLGNIPHALNEEVFGQIQNLLADSEEVLPRFGHEEVFGAGDEMDTNKLENIDVRNLKPVTAKILSRNLKWRSEALFTRMETENEDTHVEDAASKGIELVSIIKHVDETEEQKVEAKQSKVNEPITTTPESLDAQTDPKPDKGKGIATGTEVSLVKLKKALKKVRQDPDEAALVDFQLHDGRVVKMTREEIDQYLEKAEKVKMLNCQRLRLGRWLLRKVKNIADRKKKLYDRFGNFGISEWDEFGAILKSKKNKVDPSLSRTKKRKAIDLEPKTYIAGLHYNRILPKGVKFTENMAIEEPEYGMMFMDEFREPAFQRASDVYKVETTTWFRYKMMALLDSSLANVKRFELVDFIKRILPWEWLLL
ncbi:hypothetical protein Tco_1311793 [Tanacetum coccineum]